MNSESHAERTLRQRFDGQTALVTGAGQGLGAAIARALATAGANVILVDRDMAAAEAVAAAIRNDGAAATATRGDVTDEEDVRSAIGLVARLDIVVNNAAIPGPSEPTHAIDEDQFDEVFNVNVKGVFFVLKHAIKKMLGRGGSIVNISSINAVIGSTDIPAYHGTKAAVSLLTKCAAVAYAKEGIRVNAVLPGAIRTDLTIRAASESPLGRDAYLASLHFRHPIGRIAEPEEVAAAALFLAGREAAYVTGAELLCDGGYTAQ